MSYERVVEAVLWVIFAATLLKTVLVASALWGVATDSGKKAVAAPDGKRSGQASSSGAGDQAGRNTSLRPPPLGQQRAGGDRRTLPSKLRPVHTCLLVLHFLATLALITGIVQYIVPLTGQTCLAIHRVMMATLVLFDAATVVFLLAKTRVTNDVMPGSSKPALWERSVKMFSLVWAWIVLPVTAVACAAALPGGIHGEDVEDSDGCHGGIEQFEEGRLATFFFVAFLTGKVALSIEFLLLLALFVKPLYARGADGLSSITSSRHRGTIIRNIVCTVGVVTIQITEAVVVYTVVFHVGSVEVVERVADMVAMVQLFLTLCLTEITIPLGFTSSWTSCVAAAKRSKHARGTTYTGRVSSSSPPAESAI